MTEPLTTWRGCALYAKSLLERAHLDPSLHPHLQALYHAVAMLLHQDAAAPAAIPAPSPQGAVQAPQAGPWAAQAPAEQAAQPAQASSPWAAQAPAAVAPPAAVPMPGAVSAPAAVPAPAAVAPPAAEAAPAPQPAGPVTTQGETPLQPMRVFAYGNNDKGTLGQGHYRAPNWEPCREVTAEGQTIVCALGARENNAFLTQSGQLLLSGSNAAYLFMDRVSRGREVPTLPELLQGRRVTRVFFGALATHIFASLDGRLHAWGRTTNALGIDTRSPTLEPKPVERLGPLSQSGGVSADQIRQLVLSTGHSVALLADGSIHMSGGNSRGQLGMGAKNNPYEVFVFTPPDEVAGIRFVAVACATLHTAAISEDGGLYTTGRNERGELGHENLDDHYRLRRVSTGSIAGRRVVQVSCSEQATFCLTEDGQLHGAGSNSRGELGLGDTPNAASFVPLPIPGNRPVRQIAAGKHHALAWCVDNTLFSWGDNNFGQVTPGAKGRAVTAPTEVGGFSDTRILGVGCGESHSLVMVQ